MTTYITQEQSVAIAKEAGALIENWLTLPPKLGLLYLTPEQAHATCNAAIQAYRDSLVAGVVLPEPVGYLAWKNGKPCWEGDDCVCEDAVYPVCSDDDRASKAIYTADQLRQAIADALAKQVPQGYKLVPVEPTPEMVDAAFAGIVEDQDVLRQLGRRRGMRRKYEAMLAAAPDSK